MRNTRSRRLLTSGAILGAALAALAISERTVEAQDVSRCGNGSGPLCQEQENCTKLPFGKRCGTWYTYYP